MKTLQEQIKIILFDHCGLDIHEKWDQRVADGASEAIVQLFTKKLEAIEDKTKKLPTHELSAGLELETLVHLSDVLEIIEEAKE